VIGSLLSWLVITLAGHGLLRLLGGAWPVPRLGALGAASLSTLSGVALLGVLTTVIGVLGGPTRPLPLLAPLLFVIAEAGLLVGHASPRPGVEVPTVRLSRLGDVVTGLLAVGIGASLATKVAALPVWHNDEYAIWAYRGRVLSLSGQLDPRIFLGIQERNTHLDYPLLVPSLIAWSDASPRGPVDGLARVHLVVVFVALLMATGWALGRLAGSFAAIAGVLTVAAMPRGLSRLALLLTADLTLLAFAVPLVLVLSLWVRSGDRMLLACAGVLAAGAASTKAEGLLFVLAALLGAGLVLGTGNARRQLAIAAAGVAAAIAPWLLYTRLHGIENGVVNGQNLSPGNLRTVLPVADDVVAGMLSHWPRHGLHGLLVAVLLVPTVLLAGWRGHGRLIGQIAVTVGVTVAGLWLQYVISTQGTGAAAAEWLRLRFLATGYRVLLFPSLLCALAVPLLAGTSMDRGLAEPSPSEKVQSPVNLMWRPDPHVGS
jgi:hypothetical protein